MFDKYTYYELTEIVIGLLAYLDELEAKEVTGNYYDIVLNVCDIAQTERENRPC